MPSLKDRERRRAELALTEEQYQEYCRLIDTPETFWSRELKAYVNRVKMTEGNMYHLKGLAVADWIRGTSQLTGIEPYGESGH